MVFDHFFKSFNVAVIITLLLLQSARQSLLQWPTFTPHFHRRLGLKQRRIVQVQTEVNEPHLPTNTHTTVASWHEPFHNTTSLLPLSATVPLDFFFRVSRGWARSSEENQKTGGVWTCINFHSDFILSFNFYVVLINNNRTFYWSTSTCNFKTKYWRSRSTL